MCIAIPGRVTEVRGDTASVDLNGNLVNVNIGLVDARPGQYVLVHAGCAIEVMEKDKAQEIIDLFADIDELEGLQ
jgi:hydrogenase expression/formation protein HypC